MIEIDEEKRTMSISAVQRPYVPIAIHKALTKMALLAYANFTFQIFLPLCEEDPKLDGQNIKLTFVPTPLDMAE